MRNRTLDVLGTVPIWRSNEHPVRKFLTWLTDSFQDGGMFEPTRIPRYSAFLSLPSNSECVWNSTPLVHLVYNKSIGSFEVLLPSNSTIERKWLTDLQIVYVVGKTVLYTTGPKVVTEPPCNKCMLAACI